MLQLGYFKTGALINENDVAKDMEIMTRRVNWNEYFSDEKHINEMKKAVKNEEEDKKKY
jgi:hypothetical protein